MSSEERVVPDPGEMAVAGPLELTVRARRRSEAALVRAARGGDATAVEELFQRHWPGTYRAAYLVVGALARLQAVDGLAVAGGLGQRAAARLDLDVLAVQVERRLAAVALGALDERLGGQQVGAGGAGAAERPAGRVLRRRGGVGGLAQQGLSAQPELELAGELFTGVFLRALPQ